MSDRDRKIAEADWDALSKKAQDKPRRAGETWREHIYREGYLHALTQHPPEPADAARDAVRAGGGSSPCGVSCCPPGAGRCDGRRRSPTAESGESADNQERTKEP